MNIHGYIDLIIRTPELIALVEIEKARYYAKLNHVGRNSTKIERLNFYTAHWVDLYIPVYYPLEDYKNTDDPDDRQDPNALIMFYGADSSQVKGWAKYIHNGPTYRYGMQMIKSYARSMLTRPHLERSLRQLHISLLTAYTLNTDTTTTPIPTIPLDINPRTGEFVYFNVKGSFNLKEKAYKVINHLLESEDYFAEYPDLINTYSKYKIAASTSLKSELHQVIKTAKEKLEILPNK